MQEKKAGAAAKPIVSADARASSRQGWLRAAVLGANDGIVSTASLVVGVAAAMTSPATILTAGLAGLAAGALSMAAGEYVSVSSQRDLEEALLGKARRKINVYPEVATTELAIALQLRGIDPGLARLVAQQISAVDALEAYARVKLDILESTRARPLQAALASAASFAAGGTVPLLGMFGSSSALRMTLTVGLALTALGICGSLAAGAGGAPRSRAALRVVAGGGVAMAISAAIGRLVGVVV